MRTTFPFDLLKYMKRLDLFSYMTPVEGIIPSRNVDFLRLIDECIKSYLPQTKIQLAHEYDFGQMENYEHDDERGYVKQLESDRFYYDHMVVGYDQSAVERLCAFYNTDLFELYTRYSSFLYNHNYPVVSVYSYHYLYNIRK
ncbi:unnamed protein product [Didymodactylos carnosus]|uniref:Uncharacterized protein n=1 Tax=Didymodactylos carnosus TaxID=1234261 RepID=A0A814NJE9_9BILA|nr:unnamed protein product [Didymodactylos carnosus]CAF1140867.1 unnamed protein product [Didymodactylos carnosus]CAF3858224.1 unnamed protein product [Didymodactylos carnosus]CAF3936081.1 unnamed protein product [Didymodactylos carnosus]